MKKYFLGIICILSFYGLVSAQTPPFFTGNTSCPVFFDGFSNFLLQKSDMESAKQQLKVTINDAYTKIHLSSDKMEKDLLKDQISFLKKQLMFLNYKLLLLYKNEYFFRISD